MSKSSREIIALLVRDGWFEAGQTGSHRHFKHPSKPGKVTAPHPKHDLPVEDYKEHRESVGRQAHLTRPRFAR